MFYDLYYPPQPNHGWGLYASGIERFVHIDDRDLTSLHLACQLFMGKGVLHIYPRITFTTPMYISTVVEKQHVAFHSMPTVMRPSRTLLVRRPQHISSAFLTDLTAFLVYTIQATRSALLANNLMLPHSNSNIYDLLPPVFGDPKNLAKNLNIKDRIFQTLLFSDSIAVAQEGIASIFEDAKNEPSTEHFKMYFEAAMGNKSPVKPE